MIIKGQKPARYKIFAHHPVINVDCGLRTIRFFELGVIAFSALGFELQMGHTVVFLWRILGRIMNMGILERDTILVIDRVFLNEVLTLASQFYALA